jgi:pimeloyl-ACP methyl ester carboxylesterase
MRASATNAMRQVLATVCCGLWAATLLGQAPSIRGETSGQLHRSRIDDWFLSTGNWQADPQLYVREFGEGPELVVILHGGWGAEHGGLLEAVKDLKARYRFVMYDQRGSLRSPAPDASITFDRHVEDLELLRKELQVETLNLAGHSMGAVLASAYASKYPQRIKRLTLLAPAYLKNPLPDEDKPIRDAQEAKLGAFLNRPEVTQELDRHGLNRTEPPLTSMEETAKFRINLYKRMLYDIRNWRKLMGGRALYKSHVNELTTKTYPASGWNYVRDFKRHGYPVGVIVGDHDFLDFGNHVMKKWIDGESRIKLSVIERAGHLPWIDQPERFAAELRRHLDGTP